MVVRAAKLIYRLLAITGALLVVGLLVLVGRLLVGPISLPALSGYIEPLLVSEAMPEVAVADVQLGLDARGLLGLTAIDVRGWTSAGELLIQLPTVEVIPSARALLEDGVLAIGQLAAIAPSLRLTRAADGSFGLGGQGTDEQAGGDRRGGASRPFDLGPLLADFLDPETPTGPTAYLDRLSVSGGQLRYEDRVLGRTIEARDAVLVIDRRPEGLGAGLDFTFEQPGGAAVVSVRAVHHVTERWIDIEVAVEGLRLGPLAKLAMPTSNIDLTVAGRIEGRYDLDGQWSPIGFQLTSGASVIELPGWLARPLTISMAHVEGELAGSFDAVRLTKLEVRSQQTRLTGVGAGRWTEDGPAVSAELVAEQVQADDLTWFWPPAAEPQAREWVTENITTGVMPSARITLAIQPGDLDQRPVPDRMVYGSFDFTGLKVRYVDSMPALEGVDGVATFTARRMDFTVTSGHVGDLRVQGAKVTITGMGVPGREATQLEIEAGIEGPLAEALALIDHEPLGFTSELNIVPAQASGRVRTDLRISMPLHRDFDPADIRVSAEATLRDAAIAGLPGDIDLDRGQLELQVGQDQLELSGTARLDAVPVDLWWQESFAPDAAVARRFRIEGDIGADDLARVGADLPVGLEGTTRLLAEVVQGGGSTNVDLALDLAGLGIDLPQIRWRKLAGEAGGLEVSAELTDGQITVPSFALTAPGLELAGSLRARTDPPELETLRLTRVRFEEDRGRAEVRRDGRGGYLVDIDADALDLDAWIARLGVAEGVTGTAPDDGGGDRRQAAAGGGAEPGDPGGGSAGDGSPAADADLAAVPLKLDLGARSMVLLGSDLRNVDALVVRDAEGWRSADVTGDLPDGGRFELRLYPEGDRRQLRLSSDDAGSLLRVLDPGSTVRGGRVQLRAVILRQRPTWLLDGIFRVEEFTLIEAPLLGRLLTLASLTGVGNLLGGEGIYFDRLKLPFTLDDSLLTITKGRMSGSQLGLTTDGQYDLDRDQLQLEGTIVPIYTLNRILGKIPLIGDFLAGSGGEGAFAATYKVTGRAEDPKIRVNPLAVLAPGFLRELYRGLVDGTLEPPDVRPSDD